MTLLLAFVFSFLLAAVGTAIVFMLWQTLKDQAQLRRTLDIAMLQVLLPKDIDKDRGEKEGDSGEGIREKISVAEQFFSTLSNLPTTWRDRMLYGQPILVFEIVAKSDDTVVFHVGSERRYLDHLEKQIYAHYPDAEVSPAPNYTIFESADNIRVGTLKLRRAQHLPIATYRELEADPMQALTGALAKIQNRDSAVIQYILQPASVKARRKAGKAARQTVRGRQSDVAAQGSILEAAGNFMKSRESRDRQRQEASQLTGRMQQRVELTENKSAQQQFSVNIRIGVSCRQAEETERVFNAIAAAFAQYDMPDLNGLTLSTPKKIQGFLKDLIFHVPRPKSANVLSTTELASLFHFPLATTATPNILWRGAKTAPAPADLSHEGVVLGTNHYRGIETPIHFAQEDRRRHMYLIGQTGTGKTTMFLNMIIQDIKAGEGVGVVDPHGDLIEDILMHIPPERQKDVILFDPRDRDFPVGFNMLEVQDEAQKDLVVNEVVEILQKLASRLNPESVGPMFEHYLRNALLALVEDPDSTLVDVPRMFVDEPFRKHILGRVTNPVVKQFWEQEFAQSQRGQMSADMLSYVISKLGRFIGNETVRNLIGQSRSSFNVREVMDERKILLCNLSKGQLGDINSDLLGFVLVSKIQIAALGRANVSQDKRPDFYLYLDEFQNFTTDSIATILSEARKYRLNLNLTHQFIQQLDDRIKEAVFGNVGTIAAYRIGVDDAEYVAQQFEPVFTEYDLLNLKRFTAVVRLLVNQTPQRPFSLSVAAPPTGGDAQVREAIRAHSRQMYGRNRRDVEADILERFKVGSPEKPVVAPSSGDYLGESLFDIS